MKNQEIARILQNMIEEAEENLTRLAEAMRGYGNLKYLDERRAELKEAMDLEAELLAEAAFPISPKAIGPAESAKEAIREALVVLLADYQGPALQRTMGEQALAILDAVPDIFAGHVPATLETIKASAILGEALDARPAESAPAPREAKAQLAAEREQCRKAMVASQAEVDMLYVRAEKAEAEAKALREVLKTVEQPLALFVMQHPIWTLPSGVVQDPAGSHKALYVLRAALAKEAKL